MKRNTHNDNVKAGDRNDAPAKSNCQLSIANYQLILKRYWGYDSFRGIQQEIIQSIGDGKDTLGLMPTGGGKSLTFQVPALAMPGTCIVITPLISLMKDQVDHLRQKGIKAYAIYSGMSRNEILTILENCIFGDVKLLYVSPERLSSELFQTKLRKMRISFITVDEAHCISQWGYDFRPAYLEIAKIRQLVAATPPVLALTATATTEVIEDIQEQLHFQQKNVIRMSFARKNLAYVVRQAHDKLAEMIHILNHVEGTAIIYVRSRKRTKEISEYINTHLQTSTFNHPLDRRSLARQEPSTFYHAGLEPAVKDQRQEAWQQDQVRVMVATNAFGMGIDKADVRLVIHMDAPNSIEAYFQEAGRAGRDGKRAYAVLLYNDSDFTQLSKRIADTFPPKTAGDNTTEAKNYAKDNICDIYDHLAYFYQIGVGSGNRHTFEFNIDKFCTAFHHFPTRVHAALTILQRAGYVEFEQEPDTSARIRFILSRHELYRLDENAPNESAVITALLRCYGGLFSDYSYVDESLIAQEAGLDRNHTYQALKVLHQKHIIDFIPRKSTPFITYTRDREEGKDLIIPKEAYEDRKVQFERRINAMMRYIHNDYVCRSRQLLAYFGEEDGKDCGICDVCREQLKAPENGQQPPSVIQAVMDFLADKKQHFITELMQLPYDSNDISAALQTLTAEERVIMDGSYITLP